jgi:sec-independent protein translocase protein TatA
MVPGWLQILVVVILALMLFGSRGKIPELMGDFAKGIKSFKKGMKDEVDDVVEEASEAKSIDHESEEKVGKIAKKHKAS